MSGFSSKIAWRYIFSKKSTNAINIITGLSIIGITIGTAALILILSVFNGFEGLLSGLFNAFNPDLKISPESGKVFQIDSLTLQKITELEGVMHVSKTIEEVALFEYQDVQEIGKIKGVDEEYKMVTGLDSLVLLGNYSLTGKSGIPYAILGLGLRNKLSVSLENRLEPLTVYMPLKNRSFSSKQFKVKDIYPSGIFSVNSENDQQYLISSLDFATQLLGMSKNTVSYLEIKTDADADEKEISTAINAMIKTPLVIANRYQQDASFLRIMNIEKWVSYLIVSLTMLLIAFNLVGALWMIILEKKKDINVLKTMGYTEKDVSKLFISLGLLITCIGIIIGFLLALVIYFLQKKFGLVGIPEGFLIDAYPIQLKLIDFFYVSLTVIIIGYLASLLPAKRAANFTLKLQ